MIVNSGERQKACGARENNKLINFTYYKKKLFLKLA